MNEARKERWTKAEEYAKILAISKHDIYNHYFDICEKYKSYLLEPRNLEAFTRYCIAEMTSRKKLLESKNQALGIKERPYSKNEKEREPIDNLKIMLWAINQIGSIEKAEKIFNAAKLAMETIQD